LAKDLEALDKYQWAGHGVLVGTRENPLVSKIDEKSRIKQPFKDQREFSGFSEKTVDEVLAYFANKLEDARRQYRDFVEKGIMLSRRREFQGGGLFRSLGGKMAILTELKRGHKENSDQRVLGTGAFVNVKLKQAEKSLGKSIIPNDSSRKLSKRSRIHLVFRPN
jgi:hypothetical protein